MEALLQLAWEQRLWTDLRPVDSLEGCTIEVLDVGLHNRHSGPDFLEAKVRIDDIVWVGAVEIHQKASEWLGHQHHLDPAYSSTILHVVAESDEPIFGYNGRLLPTLVMEIPEGLKSQAEYLVRHATQLSCSPLGSRIPEPAIYHHLDTLLHERLRQKAKAIITLAEELDWYEALYITVFRYFGFDLNNEAMEHLARRLPYKLLLRYADDDLSFYALLLGQANMLRALPHGEHRQSLEQEYRFLCTKHSLSPMPESMWRMARTRPASFPLRRLIQVGEVVRAEGFKPSRLNGELSVEELRQFFMPRAEFSYWSELYTEGRRKASFALSRSTIDSLIINIALPYRLAYRMAEAEEMKDLSYERRVLMLLPAEANKITRLYERAGVVLRHAGDSQAVIQAYKAYCQKRKCFFCAWGRRLLAHSSSID